MEYRESEIITYKSWADVAWNVPLLPMLAAVMTCTAQPQSTEARPAIKPIVFASGNKRGPPELKKTQAEEKYLHPTNQQSKFLQRGEENE